MGLIFAHEILHGFDLKGVRYNSKGGNEDLLNQFSKVELESRLDCVVNQFATTFWKQVNFLGKNIDVQVRISDALVNADASRLPEFDFQFDWNVTKNENMADISGLQLAYHAWETVIGLENEPTLPGIQLNARQLFFLNAAQVRSQPNSCNHSVQFFWYLHCICVALSDLLLYAFSGGLHFPRRSRLPHASPRKVMFPPGNYSANVTLALSYRVNGIMMNSQGFADAYKCPVGSPMNPKKKCSVW